MSVYETSRFVVEIGVVPLDIAVPAGGYIPEQLPQYLVRNKQWGVVEFCNPSLYFVRDWADQMTGALDKQEKSEDQPTAKIVPFPEGGGNGRTN